MHIFKKIGTFVGTAAIICTYALSTHATSPRLIDDIIKERQQIMKNFASAGRQLNELISSDPASAIANLENLIISAKNLPSLFPEGSGNPPFSNAASPEIWKNWNVFNAATDVLITEMNKIVSLLKAGDTQSAQQQFGNMMRVGCGTCHSKFRPSKR